MKFYIEIFGCKVNTYESNFIKKSLIEEGFFYADSLLDANIVIVNTCTVTNMSDTKCRKYIRRVKRENPNAILVVVGCSIQYNPDVYKDMSIDILLGNRYKSKLGMLIKDYLVTKEKYQFIENSRKLDFEDMRINNFDHTRAFIKIQDGCDNFCSYCIIPFVRGSIRSKNFELIKKEAEDLVKNNHYEIVLTGIHTGSYNDNGHDLVDVINELSKIENLKRIRLSSVEITELNDKFFTMLKNNPKFCNHLHIPLQSGSNEVLKKMNRKYDMAYFFQVIEKIRSIRPDISITTDIIVGFPESSVSNFEETYENALKLRFSKMHVFPYSKRNGTKASLMKEIDGLEKTRRVHKLLELSNYLEEEYQKKFVGKKVDVLIEEVNDNVSVGHTSNYLRVEINEKLLKNQIYEVIYK